MTLQSRELSLLNHRRFIERVAASGEVWGLRSNDGWVVCHSTSDEKSEVRDVMPFWSDRAYAARAAVDEWAAYVPTRIPVQSFIEEWLVGISADHALVGTNWDAANCGLEVDPEELSRELTTALSRAP